MTHNVFDSCVPTFILAGQSNTLGHNIEARDLPPWLRARAAAFEASVVTMGMNASHCDRWSPFYLERTQEMFCGELKKFGGPGGRNVRGGPGPEAGFAHLMTAMLPRSAASTATPRLGLLKAALGGSPIAVWDPRAAEPIAWRLLERAIAAARKGVAPCVAFKGLVWNQGEAEAQGLGVGNADRWGDAFAALLAAVRRATGEPNLPAVVGRTVVAVDWRVVPGRPWKSRFQPFERSASATAVRRAQVAAADAPHKNVGWVDLDDLPRSAGAHFTAPHYAVMGLRFAAAMLELMNGGDARAAATAAPHRNSTAARAFSRARVNYGGAFATATDADPVAPKPPREPVRKASCAEDLDGCGGPRARRRRRGRG